VAYRWIQKDVGATLAVDLDERPDAGATFTTFNPSGGTAQASTAVTIESVNTTLSSAAASAATTVPVVSAANVTVGRTYLIGGREDVGGERITVKSISGTTLTLVRPLRLAQASGATFQSTRCECAVTAGNSASTGRHYRIEITYTISAATRPKAIVDYDVVRYALQTFLTLEKLSGLDPLARRRLSEGTWFPELRDQAWEMMLHEVAGQKDPGALVGAIDLTVPHQYLVRALIEEPGGEQRKDQRELYARRYTDELNRTLAAHAVDDDQDGAIERHEGWTRSISIARA